ncbi:MAG: sialidase family protein [Kiritimatiellia bacterium]|nr:glycoside hydrolase [Lentisphaerota bacterium]
MAKLKPRDLEHGVVIPCGEEQRIPAAAAWAQSKGLRGMHYGWPGLTRTRAGDLLVGASERHVHIDPFGREVVVRSTDNGRTWSAPEVIFDSLTDDRDIALNTLPDGTVVATWFSSAAWASDEAVQKHPEWKPMRESLNTDTLRALARGWLRRSHDGGRTWEERIYPTLVGQHAGPSPLANGDLIYLGPYRSPHPEFNDRNNQGQGKTVLAATRSSDGGCSWELIGAVPGAFKTDPATGKVATILNENHVLELEPGRLLAAFRIQPDACAEAGGPSDPRFQACPWLAGKTLHFAHSEDGGRRWSAPEDSGVFGFPPYLLRLRSGPILCVFADRVVPRTIRCMLSYDHGRSWDRSNVHILRQFDDFSHFAPDMGYPVAVETESGEVLCIYYAIPKHDQTGYAELDMNAWGILSTRFKLDEI